MVWMKYKILVVDDDIFIWRIVEYNGGQFARRKIMYVLLKSLIAVAQERNQLVDITPEFPDILIQSFPDYLPQPFHK